MSKYVPNVSGVSLHVLILVIFIFFDCAELVMEIYRLFYAAESSQSSINLPPLVTTFHQHIYRHRTVILRSGTKPGTHMPCSQEDGSCMCWHELLVYRNVLAPRNQSFARECGASAVLAISSRLWVLGSGTSHAGRPSRPAAHGGESLNSTN